MKALKISVVVVASVFVLGIVLVSLQRLPDIAYRLQPLIRTQAIYSEMYMPPWCQENVSLNSPYHSNTTSDNCTSYQVPNVVHYIWYSKQHTELKFHEMLSVLSAHKYLHPYRIYFYTNNEPKGKYWDLLNRLPEFQAVNRQPPVSLFGKKLPNPVYDTSYSDVDRLIVLSEHGGIYLDLDILITNTSFHSLRKYPCTVGLEMANRVCGGLVICRQDSPFLHKWLRSYLDDFKSEWAYNSGIVPLKLSKKMSEHVHVEPKRLHKPTWIELEVLFGNEVYPWRNNYAVHLWQHAWHESKYKTLNPNFDNIKKMNNTFAEIAMAILQDTSIMTN